jgi:hypothetical protein
LWVGPTIPSKLYSGMGSGGYYPGGYYR